MAEQENHNLCVRGSNPFAAISIMMHISEYRKEITSLGEHVSNVSSLMNGHSINLTNLTQQLETLFKLFSRGDELISIIQTYSQNLQDGISHVKETYQQYENAIEATDKELVHMSQLLKSITDSLQDTQTNARLFIESSQSLANLAKNTEIRAHHAKKEGIGLTIIAKECLTLAKRAQLPFRNFGSLLQNLKNIAKPVITELDRITELSSRSKKLLKKSLESLKTIDDITSFLQKMMARIEEDSAINNQLKLDVREGLDILNNQLLLSLNTIDTISLHCAEINALSQILDTLNSIGVQINDGFAKKEGTPEQYGTSQRKSFLNTQFNFYVRENIRKLRKLSLHKNPPSFPNHLYKNITTTVNRVKEINASVTELKKSNEDLDRGSSEVVVLGTQLENFLKETHTIYRHLSNVGNELHDEVEKIEQLITTTKTLFMKIKTLSVFARIEEGRSFTYHDIISPIVDDFVELESETEGAFSKIIPKILRLQKQVQYLRKERPLEHLRKIQHPHYSKIRIFLEDIMRVFDEEEDQVQEIHSIAETLNRENISLKETWLGYESAISHVTAMISSLDNLLRREEIEAPAVITRKNVVSINLPDDPLTLYPDLKTDVNSHRIIGNFSTGLFRFGESADVIPGLCEDYSTSRDGTEYIFRIRENVRYQNGALLTSAHIRDGLIKAVQGPNFNFFDMIAGVKDFVKTKNKQSIAIKIIDNSTLKMTLEYPFPPILSHLATNCADPYFDEEFPIGVGPFKMVRWEKGENIILTAHEGYFEGRPTIDELNFLIIEDEEHGYELFKNGLLSIFIPTGEVINKAKTESPNLLHTIPEMSVRYLCMNCQERPFNNKRVRKAIAHAIDTKRFVNTFLKDSAIAAQGIFPPSMKVYNHKLVGCSFNLARAKGLLADAGFRNGLPDIYTLDVGDTQSEIRQAEFIKSSLADIGIIIEINPMPWHSLVEKTCAGESILSFRGWVNDNGDPDNFMYPLFHSTSHGRTGNTFFFSSPDIDQAIDTARKIRNVNQRNLLYREIEEKILDESPGVFLFHRLQHIAIQKDILGLKPHPLGLVRAKNVYPVGTHSSVLPYVRNRVHKEHMEITSKASSKP